jgi:hypothetical protein
MVRFMRLTALLLCAAACGNPDNLVIGGISATATIPVALIDSVRSAISGIATRTDQSGQRQVVILSNTAKLCDQLGAHTDYFRNPPEAYVAIIFYLPLDRLGTFYIRRPGDPPGTDGEIVAASTGIAPSPYFALGLDQGLSSYVILTDVSPSGGNAVGSFDLIFPDKVGSIHEFYGRFKVGSCPALQNVLLP